MFKKEESKTKTGAVTEADVKAAGEPPPELMAAATEEITKEERHPATKAAMAARFEEKGEARTFSSSRGPVVEALAKRLLAAGGHAQHCPTRLNSTSACACPWGEPAAEAEELFGIRAERERKAAEELEAHRVKAGPT